MTEFEACYTFACPKFLSAIPPSLEEAPSAAGEALHKEPLRLQMKVFMDEVKQQMLLPTVRSYLKLYTSMPLEKLADYMSITVDELEMENNVLEAAHRSKMPRRPNTSLSVDLLEMFAGTLPYKTDAKTKSIYMIGW